MTALFVALEHEIADFDPYVEGHALAANEKPLERLAKELGVTPLMDFFGQDVSETGVFADEEWEEHSSGDLPDARWFDADRGLETIDALAEHIEAEPDSVPEAAEVLLELGEWRSVLERAAEEDIRWHMEVDF